MRRSAATLLLAVVVVAACSGDDGDDPGPAATATTRVASTTSTAVGSTTVPATGVPTTTIDDPACPEPAEAGEVRVTGGDLAAPGLLFEAVVEPADACTDRFALAFSESVPGYTVEYQEGPFVESGSGARIAVDGNVFLVVRLEPSYTFDFEHGAETYTGPREITPAGTRFVREVVLTGDFEGVVTWVVGLSEQVPLHVASEQNAGAATLLITLG